MGFPGPADAPDLPRGRRPRARAAVRHQAGGGEVAREWRLQSSPGCYWEDGGGLRVEDNFLITGRRAPRSSPASRMGSSRRASTLEGLDRVVSTRGARSPAACVVGLYDTTLRDGEQSVGVVLSPEQKLEIARAARRRGIDRIEAGFPRVSDDDCAGCRADLAAGLRPRSGAFRVRCGLTSRPRRARRAASVIESPISDVQTRGARRLARRCSNASASAIRFAASRYQVAFFGWTRLAPTSTSTAVRTRLQSRPAREEVVVVDTLGIATPEAAAYLVGRRSTAGGGSPCTGTATTTSGSRRQRRSPPQAGATWVQGTVNGMGERAGNADLIEVALALRRCTGSHAARPEPGRSALDARRRTRRQRRCRRGRRSRATTLFIRESGAVAAQFHDPPAIEPYCSELVGAERGMVLGKKSGIDSIGRGRASSGSTSRRNGGGAARRGEAARHARSEDSSG